MTDKDNDKDNASTSSAMGTMGTKLVVLPSEEDRTPIRKRNAKLRTQFGKRITKQKPKVTNVWEKLVRPKLEQITDWRRDWRSVAWICNKLGIAQSSFYALARKHPELGKAMLDAQVGMEDTGVGRMADIFMGRAKKRETVVGIDRGQKTDYERVRDYDAPERAGVWLLSVYMGLANKQQAPAFELSKEEYEKRLALDFGHKEFVNLQERDEQAGLTGEKVIEKIVFEPKRFGHENGEGLDKGASEG